MTRGPGRTHALRGAVQIFLFCQHDCARVWRSDEPRRGSAWRERLLIRRGSAWRERLLIRRALLPTPRENPEAWTGQGSHSGLMSLPFGALVLGIDRGPAGGAEGCRRPLYAGVS